MNTEKIQKQAAAEFAARWKDRGSEKEDSQRFWIDLLENVYGIKNVTEFVRFEEKAALDNTSFIDVMIPSTKVMIEQKSSSKDLRKPIKQSDGTMLTPFQQAQRYVLGLPVSQHPRWIVTCNFKEILVYDMENPNSEPQEILLENLGREYYRLQFLVDTGSDHLKKEMEVSIKAGELVGRIYDDFIQEYDANDPMSLRYLNILCVRLVFCLYAEDAGIFGKHDMFHDYLAQFPTEQMREELLRVFRVLNTPEDKRSKYLRPDLAAFPYTNGGLFAEEIDVPQFTDRIRATLLLHASMGFDWSQISPTIFGGVFESTLNPETRRSGGMHYTSIENIHKVIDPLFLDDLKREFTEIMDEAVVAKRLSRLHAFQDKLASLVFFDPACGSGNFLTETYLSLRRLENEVIKAIYSIEPLDAFTNPIKVSINQFYGIEINDFAVTVATTALWISESQMMAETEHIIRHGINFLPLKSYSNIHEGNALRIDWHEVCPQPNYIIGNPPFVGARLMSSAQKDDMLFVFGKDWKNIGNIDYVGAWYYKATQMMLQAGAVPVAARIRTALVSTNSITQGEQVANLWAPLMAEGVHIDFACRTFRWDSEASLKAHVHVVVVGFSCSPNDKPKIIFDNGQRIEAKHINPYLIDGPDVFIISRNKPLFSVPNLITGNQRLDNDYYMFTKEEMEEFVNKEPSSAKHFRLWYGAVEFLYNKPRYCLFLGDCTPAELRSMPRSLELIKKVREWRLQSKRKQTVLYADRPSHFYLEVIPKNNFIIIPVVTSERRRYIPMGFMSPDVLCSNQVNMIENATLYHFGVLESNVHMAWMRAVCGRLEMRYRYSKDVVYNNFPWPDVTEEQRQRIEQTAQAILDARAKYPDSSLADLYDPNTMPYDLLEAHRANDRAVMAAYGFSMKLTESECVAKLLEMYSQLVKKG